MPDTPTRCNPARPLELAGVLLIVLSACSSQDPRRTSSTSVSPDSGFIDDQDSAPEEDASQGSSEQTIGPEGGEIGLPNGTTIVVPAGALEADTTLSITEVASEETGFESNWTAALAAFEVEPPVVTVGAHFEIRLPADAHLVLSDEGIVETVNEDGTFAADHERVHQLLSPDEQAAEGTVFQQAALGGATYQPMVDAQAIDAPAGPPPPSASAIDAILRQTCQDAINDHMPSPPSGVDLVIRKSTSMRAEALANYATLVDEDGQPDTAKQQAFLAGMARFQARACYGAFASARHYHDTMGIDLSLDGARSRRIPLTLSWSHWLRTGPRGWTNPWGVSVFFNPFEQSRYIGEVAVAGVEWNAAPTGAASQALMEPSKVEKSTAHEIFHYAVAWADGVPFNPGSMEFLEEGAAQAASDEAFDAAALGAPQNIWSSHMFNPDQSGEDYAGYSFWKWLEWQQLAPSPSGHVLRLLLDRLSASGDEIGWSDVIAVAQTTTGRSDITQASLAADYAAAHSFQHDFERAVGSTGADRFDDARGSRLDETSDYNLWGTNRHTSADEVPAVDTPRSRTAITTRLEALFSSSRSIGVTVPSWSAQVVEIDARVALSEPDACDAVVTFAASSEQLALRVFRRPVGNSGRANLVWSADALPGRSLQLRIPAAIGALDTLVVVATAVGSSEVTLDVELEVPLDALPDEVAVVGRDSWYGGLGMFRWDGSQTSHRSLAGATDWVKTFDAGGRSVARDRWLNRVYVTSHDGFLAGFDLQEGSESELDWIPSTSGTIDRLELGVGSEPRGVATLPQGAYAVVATADGLVLVDTLKREVIRTASLSDLGLVTDERPYDLAADDRGEYLWVTVYHRYQNPTERVLRVHVADFIEGTLVIDEVETGTNTMPVALALSPDGRTLAVACTGATEHGVAIIGTSGAPSRQTFADGWAWGDGNLHSDPYFVGSGGIADVAWSPDGTAVYAGHYSGHGYLSSFGIVKRCELSIGSCDHEVGIDGTTRSIVVTTDSHGDEVVLAMDDMGWLTPLHRYLFDPAPDSSGEDNMGHHDGTGGCLEDWGYLKAVSCTNFDGQVDLSLEQAGGDMIRW